MLERLQRFDPDTIEMTEAIALMAFAKLIQNEYEELQYPDAPEWLTKKIKVLRTLINMKSRDALELRLSQARAQQRAMEPEGTKRQRINKEIADLEKRLATA